MIQRLLRKFNYQNLNSTNFTDNSSIPSNIHTIYTFSQILQAENNLSHQDLLYYSELYSDSILNLYKTTFDDKHRPIFKSSKLYKRLIDSIPDNIIKKLKVFSVQGMHKNTRPIISFSNHCEYRLMDRLILNYQRDFINYIFHRLPRRLQYILLTSFIPHFHPNGQVDLESLSLHFKHLYPNVSNIPFVVLLRITHNYSPIEIVITNTERFEYNKRLTDNL